MKQTVLNLLTHTDVTTAYVIHLFGEGQCNNNCLWCPRLYPSIFDKCKIGRITLAQFEHFLKLNEKCKSSLIPYGLGEPTIHPDFVPMLSLALVYDWKLESVHTNLATPSINRDILWTLLQFKSVTINVGGGRDETHKFNCGSHLKDILHNLVRLTELKKNLYSRTKITVKMVQNKYNLGEEIELQKKFDALKLKLTVKPYPLYFAPADGDEKDKFLFYQRNLADKKVPCRDMVTLKEDGTINVNSRLANLNQCYGIGPTIHVDGGVTVCCRARWYGGVVGNAFEKSMREIMCSRQYKQAVKKAKRRQYVEYCKYCS